MSRRRIAAIAVSGAVLAGGAGAAIAAVGKDDERNKAEQEILADAAKRLDVTPDKLRDALSAAQDAQLDKAVTAGKLTRKQADLIKERRQKSGAVLGNRLFMGPGHELRLGPGGKPRLHGGPGFEVRKGRGFGVFGDLAKAIGITPRELRRQLIAGKSIADIAKAEGKSLDDVRSAAKADAKKAADKAVRDGDLTRSQADKLLEHLDERLEHLDELPALPRRSHRGRPELKHGSFMPEPPDLPRPPDAPVLDFG